MPINAIFYLFNNFKFLLKRFTFYVNSIIIIYLTSAVSALGAKIRLTYTSSYRRVVKTEKRQFTFAR